VSVEVRGLAETRERLSGVADRLDDMRPVMQSEARRIGADIDRAWDARRGPNGREWPLAAPPKLSRRPAPRRRARGGRLRRAHDVSPERRGFRVRVPVTYATFQFFGTEDIPSRNPLPFVKRGSGFAWAATGPGKRSRATFIAAVRRFVLTGRT